MSPPRCVPERAEVCKAAICAELMWRLDVEPSNIAYAVTFHALAEEEFDRLCDQDCDGCPIGERADLMKAVRLDLTEDAPRELVTA